MIGKRLYVLVAIAAIAAIAAVAMAGAARAEDSPGPRASGPRETGLTERLEVSLRQVNFIAVDRRGAPVTGLRLDEVVLLDDGVEQELAVLEPYYRPDQAVRADDPAATPETAAPAGPDGPAAEDDGGKGEGPRRVVERRRFMILFFDNFASRPPARVKAIEAALEFIENDLEPDDVVAIVSFQGELHLLQSFTSDRVALRAAVGGLWEHARHATTDRYDQLTELMRDLETCRDNSRRSSCARHLSGAYEDERRREAHALLTGLTQLLRSVSAISEPKALLLFSNGVARSSTADPRDAARAVLGDEAADQMVFGQADQVDEWSDRLAVAAAEAQVSIFTINAGGAAGNPMISAERSSQFALSNGFTIDVFSRSDRNAQASLSEMAARTGGTSTQANDPLDAMRDVVAQTRGMYTVGYYPSRVLPGAAHDVKIKIKRRGVKAVWPRDLPPLPRRGALAGVMTVDAKACSEASRRVLIVRLEVELGSLSFESLEDQVVNNFSVYTTLLDEDGIETLYRDYRLLNIDHGRDEFGSAPNPVIERTLTVPCRPLTVRTSVVDAVTGAYAKFEEAIGP